MNRHEATRRVMRSIMKPGNTAKLRYVAPDGSRPLVVCTPNEYLSEVAKRVDAVGGSANVVLAEVKRFRIVVMESVPADAAPHGAEDVNADISMGMFLIRATSRKNQGLYRIGGVNVEAGAQAFEYA